MKELKFVVETISPVLKLGEDTITRYSMSKDIEDNGKIKVEFTFKESVPTEYLKLLGDQPGNEIIVTIGAKSRQTKLTE